MAKSDFIPDFRAEEGKLFVSDWMLYLDTFRNAETEQENILKFRRKQYQSLKKILLDRQQELQALTQNEDQD
jgi:hypothetical protein